MASNVFPFLNTGQMFAVFHMADIVPDSYDILNMTVSIGAMNGAKKMKEIQTDPAPQPDQPDWCTCTYCSEMPEGEKVCCKENTERCHSRMPVNIICFIPLLLFCCMILFLTVLWLHQY
jgi:hypothetical protein